MKAGKVVGQGRRRSAQPPVESGDLHGAPLDLSREVYLTVAEAARYTRSVSVPAFRKWAYRAHLPKCRRGRRVLYFRRDIDAALQPEYMKPSHRRPA